MLENGSQQSRMEGFTNRACETLSLLVPKKRSRSEESVNEQPDLIHQYLQGAVTGILYADGAVMLESAVNKPRKKRMKKSKRDDSFMGVDELPMNSIKMKENLDEKDGEAVSSSPTYRGDRNDTAKPPYSYASLIAQALLAAPDRRLTLSQVYEWIKETFPYYRSRNCGWQNSIRHNLSLNKCFVKIPRTCELPGKGAYWTIDLSQMEQFEDGMFRRRRSKSIMRISPEGIEGLPRLKHDAKHGSLIYGSNDVLEMQMEFPYLQSCNPNSADPFTFPLLSPETFAYSQSVEQLDSLAWSFSSPPPISYNNPAYFIHPSPPQSYPQPDGRILQQSLAYPELSDFCWGYHINKEHL